MAQRSNTSKRVKGVQIARPFIPDDAPKDHTHSWTVFVKGVDDTDITYWCKKVQFKLHESIPNPLRMVEGVPPGGAFEVHETGWGEFEVNIKLYYVSESNEKPQTLYHHLRLHPYGSEQDQERQKADNLIKSWNYEEECFNEPYESFYEILTSRGKAGEKGNATRVMKGGMVGSVGERTAGIPIAIKPDQPFAREAEKIELEKLNKATQEVRKMTADLAKELDEKKKELEELRKGG